MVLYYMIIKSNEKKQEIVGKIKMKKNKKNNESRNIKAKNNRTRMDYGTKKYAKIVIIQK